VEQQRALEDFDAARFRAFRRAILATLTGRARHLLSVDQVLGAAGQEGRSSRGVKEIPLDRVIGSASPVAKGGDFDPGFLPVNRRLRDRWTRIYQAMTEGDELPPIDVYKVGDSYYVIDGHHRVSVARALGRETLPARITEVATRAPLGEGVDPAALLRAAEYASFLDVTQLHRSRPEARLECSRLGRYDEILAHIHGHRYFVALETGRQPSLAEAAASWYDNVYLPVVDLVRKHEVLGRLPGWTEADLYVEITRRWLALSQAGVPAGPETALESLLVDRPKPPRKRRRKGGKRS
jgi:uncharacterized ParB-like nuclease family protein